MVCCIIFLVFSIFHIQKGVHVIIGLKLDIRNMSSVTMFKHIIFYKNEKGISDNLQIML